MSRLKRTKPFSDADADAYLAQLLEEIPACSAEEAAAAFRDANLSTHPLTISHRQHLTFCQSVRARLEALDMTQAELAAQMGKKPQAISRALNTASAKNLTLDTMAEFASALGLELSICLAAPDAALHSSEGAGVASTQAVRNPIRFTRLAPEAAGYPSASVYAMERSFAAAA